jgi:iron complex outermembrane recepter protein
LLPLTQPGTIRSNNNGSGTDLNFNRALVYTLAATLCTGAVAWADDTSASDAGNLEAISVFGSRVKDRSVFDSAVPIDVFTPGQVATALVSGELGQALQALSPSVNMPRASSSGTSDSVRTIQLRGLAPDQVLVLVNGKRRHTNAVMDIEGLFPGTVAVDVNAIPPEAIDHIEILRDGAGAMYGSDAIAGVVNIVLKSGANGGDVDALYGENRTKFAPTGQTITDGRSKTINADYGVPLGGGWIHFGADYRDSGATNRAGPSSSSASYNSTPADVALNNRVVFQSGDPATINKSVFYNASFPLAEGYEIYSFATANWRDTWGAAFFRYPGDPTNVPSIYPDGFRPVSTGLSQDASVVGGAKGDLGGWKWDLSGREGYNTFSYGLENSLNASLGPDSPTQFHVANFTYEERALNLDISREQPVPGLAAPIDLSAGAEYMHESYHTSPGDPASYEAGPFTYDAAYGEAIPPGSQGDNGLSPQDAVHLQRHVASLYLDADNELTSRLLVGIAGRYSDYSDYGSSTTGKFSVRFKLTEDFLLRASASNSFRAPALAQEGIRITTLNFNATGTALQNTEFLPPTSPLAAANGGLPLQPEKSVNYTAGLAWRAPANTAVTLDVYQIRIRDRITPTGQIPVDDPAYPDIAAVSFLTNGLDTTTRGLDLVVDHDESVAGGQLKLSGAFNRNYLHQDALRNALVNAGNVNETVLIPLEFGSPATKLVLSADWSNARWGASVQPIRYGSLYAFSYDSTLPTLNGANVQKYSAAWTVNAEAHVNVLGNLTLAIGGTDIFNRYPDQTTPGGAYYGAFPYNYANPVGINGAFYYLRASLKLGGQ